MKPKRHGHLCSNIQKILSQLYVYCHFDYIVNTDNGTIFTPSGLRFANPLPVITVNDAGGFAFFVSILSENIRRFDAAVSAVPIG